jgi:hypothetical protein
VFICVHPWLTAFFVLPGLFGPDINWGKAHNQKKKKD